MQTILDILKEAGGYHAGLYLKIDNAPFMDLVIEAVYEPGPCGLPALSVAHYGEQNGDAMRYPEMLFELAPQGGLNPFYHRNDYVSTEQWSRYIADDQYYSRREPLSCSMFPLPRYGTAISRARATSEHFARPSKSAANPMPFHGRRDE